MRKSIVELLAQATASFPDNTTGAVTPALLRDFCIDFLNAIAPAYGYMSRLTAAAQVFGLTDILVAFTGGTAVDSNPAQTTSVIGSASVTRSERGTSTINFAADMETNSGRFITFTIYKNGVATPWRITGNGGGAGNPVSVALTAIDYADPAAVYTVRAAAEQANTSVTLSNMAFVVAVDPVRTFT